jgi:quercetin dioxygenase-like cupin family protein
MDSISSKFIKKVLDMETLLSYQNNAIVSSMIIAKNTGTVTLFAFDKGEGLSEHSAPYDAMVYIVDGKSEITISGEKFIVSAGEFIIMPANEPHALNACENFKMLLIMIKEPSNIKTV